MNKNREDKGRIHRRLTVSGRGVSQGVELTGGQERHDVRAGVETTSGVGDNGGNIGLGGQQSQDDLTGGLGLVGGGDGRENTGHGRTPLCLLLRSEAE